MTLINLKTYQLAILFLLNTVILVASIKIIIEVANTNIHSKYFVKGVLIFLLSFLPMQVLAEIGTGKLYMAKVLVDLPLYLFIIYDIFLIISETIFLVNFIKTNKKIIGKNSIKESMDNLTDGICFSKLDGTPLLVNRVMQNISYEVFGRMLVNDVACSEDLRKKQNKKRSSYLAEKSPCSRSPRKNLAD